MCCEYIIFAFLLITTRASEVHTISIKCQVSRDKYFCQMVSDLFLELQLRLAHANIDYQTL